MKRIRGQWVKWEYVCVFVHVCMRIYSEEQKGRSRVLFPIVIIQNSQKRLGVLKSDLGGWCFQCDFSLTPVHFIAGFYVCTYLSCLGKRAVYKNRLVFIALQG